MFRWQQALPGFHEGATFFELQEFVAAAQGLKPVPVQEPQGNRLKSVHGPTNKGYCHAVAYGVLKHAMQ